MKRFLPILILLVFAIACEDKQITTEELSLNPTDVYIKELYSEQEPLRPGEQIDLGVTLVGTSSEWTYEWTCNIGTVSGNMTSIIWSAPFEAGEFGITFRLLVEGVIVDSVDAVFVVLESDDPLGYWVTRSPLPRPRQEIAPAYLNGKIYVVGGMTSTGSPSNMVDIYNPETDRWSVGTPLPVARHHLSLTAAYGKLYAIGGVSSAFPTFTPALQVFEYDPSTDSWTSKAPLEHTKIEHVAATVDGKIYVVGGRNEYVSADTLEIYDPLTDVWTRGAPLSLARTHSSIAVIDNKLYAAGGRTLVLDPGSIPAYHFVNYNQLEVYSPDSDSWENLLPMPTARSALGAASLDGKLYTFGGEYISGPSVGWFAFDKTEAYDPISGSWTSLASIPSPRHSTVGVTVGRVIYLIGGADQAAVKPTGANQVFVP
jgi:N-acetylneuraminic acid mutarotase